MRRDSIGLAESVPEHVRAADHLGQPQGPVARRRGTACDGIHSTFCPALIDNALPQADYGSIIEESLRQQSPARNFVTVHHQLAKYPLCPTRTVSPWSTSLRPRFDVEQVPRPKRSSG